MGVRQDWNEIGKLELASMIASLQKGCAATRADTVATIARLTHRRTAIHTARLLDAAMAPFQIHTICRRCPMTNTTAIALVSAAA
jgi:hypothetical protein